MTRRDYPTPGQPIDWRAEPITPQEHAAYDRGFAQGIRRAWWLASLVAGGAAVAVVALVIRALHP
jgi:hypothetical protein